MNRLNSTYSNNKNTSICANELVGAGWACDNEVGGQGGHV